MSTTIDQRVVEMRFDNAHFEKNVQTTISTLDKLKEKLHLTGASKGLETINNASKNNNIGMLGQAAEQVGIKFSAMQVAGVTAIARITNSVMSMGEKMIKAVTIDPVKTGFQEYETQMNAVQTILANTSSKGNDIHDVNKALDELNKYADQTIYNFTEMTRNIGTFTAAGVGLETSVAAIKGIANLAAVSGSTSQQASTAMYQLSQALAAGTVKLQDWNSVVNAGMGGEVFQNALKRTATVMGTDVDALIEKFGSFRESLSRGEWLTTDVLTETLNQFTMAAKEGTAQWEEYKKSLREKGYTEAQAIEILKMANTATDAATKVKTFTQLWDVLKESAQSGWSNTWKIIVGDFEEAKEMLSPLADVLTGIIGKMSDARNAVLESGLGKGFTDLKERISSISKPAVKAVESVNTAVKAVKATVEGVETVMNGVFGNGPERWKKLTEAGYDWADVQNKINEQYGSSVRHTSTYAKVQAKTVEAQQEVAESQGELIEELVRLDEATLISKGYTEDQIDAFKELANTADKLGLPITELIDNIDQINGRWLLIESFKNIGSSILKILNSLGAAWRDAFPIEDLGSSLFNAIAMFHKFTTHLKMSDETAEKLTRTFRGVIAIFDIIVTTLSGGLKITFKLLTGILQYFNSDWLSVTALIGDTVAGFRDWYESLFNVGKILDAIVPTFKEALKAIGGWVEAFKQLPQVQQVMARITAAFEDFKKLDFKTIGEDILQGLVNGLTDGVKFVVQKFIDLGNEIVARFCDTVGVQSPSVVFYEIGQYIVEGLVNGITVGIKWAINGMQALGQAIVDFFRNAFSGGGTFVQDCIAQFQLLFLKFKELLGKFDYKKLLALVPVAAVLFMVKKVADVATALADGVNNLNDVIEAFAGVGEELGKGIKRLSKALSFKAYADGIKQLAISIAILVGSIVVLTMLDPEKMMDAVGVVVTLALVLGGLAFAMSKMSDASVKLDKNGLNVDGLKMSLLTIAGALLILAVVARLLGGMSPDELDKAFAGLTVMLVEMGIFLAALQWIVKDGSIKRIDKVGELMTKLAIALGIMAIVCRLISGLSYEQMGKAVVFIAGFYAFVMALVGITKMTKKQQIAQVGGLLIKIAIAMGLMVGVCKLVSGLSIGEMVKGALFAAAFLLFIRGLVSVTTIGADRQTAKVGALCLSISFSLMLLIGVCKLVGMLSVEDMVKGAAFAAGFLVFVAVLVRVTQIGSDQQIAKMAGMIFSVTFAIGILGALCVLLGMVDTGMLAKGVIAVTMLGAILAVLLYATKGAQSVVGNLVMITIALALLVGAVVGFSLIEPKKLAGATIALGLIMGMFALVLKCAGSVNSSIGSLIVMTVAVGLIGGMLFLISKLPVESTLKNAIAMSTLLLAVTASVKILSTVHSMSAGALIVMGVLTLIVAGLAGILYLIKDLPVESTLANTKAISTLLLTLTAVTAVLTFVGAGALAALAGVGAFALVIAGVGGVIVALGYLSEKCEGLNDFLDKGIPVLEKIGYGIGSFVGNLIGGLMGGLTDGLPEVATNLSTFMDNLKGFIDGAKNIDEATITGVTNIAKAIAILSAAELIAGIAGYINQGMNFAQFGTDLSDFMTNAGAFFSGLQNVDPACLEGIKTLAETILILTGADIVNGIASWFTGGNSISEFGSQLGELGTHLNTFATNLGSFDEAKATSVKLAAEAIKELALAANEIPNEGGWAGKIFGENSILTFAGSLPALGNNLATFATNLGTFDETTVTTFECVGKAITALATAANEIPNEGGWLSTIFGDNSISSFGDKLPLLGTHLKNFATNLGTFDDTTVKTVDCAGRAIKAMAQAAQGIDGQAEWTKTFVGDNSITAFASKLPVLGTNLSDFATNLGTFDDAKVATVNCAVKAINALTKLTGTDLKSASSSISGFGDDLSTLATDMSTFCDNMPESGSIDTAVGNVGKIVTMINTISSEDSSIISEFSKNLKSIGMNAVKQFVTAFTSEAANSDVLAAGENLINKTVEGAEKKEDTAKSAFQTMVRHCADAIKDYWQDFYDAGNHLVGGFAKGIDENDWKAEAKAESMAKAAKLAAEKALGIQSPSKVFYKIGRFVVQGFVNAISNGERSTVSAVSRMSDVATNGFGNAMNKISEFLNSDMETNPTIRPVLDLSDVRSGAESINGMFGMNPSVDVMSRLGTIGTNMNSRNQNGSNADVVSAINKLGSILGNTSGNTYQINGITYNDDTPIAEAVGALIRATVMEGRV